MKKRVWAALLALLLTGWLSCPAARADGPPEPAEGGTIEQPLTPTPSDAPAPETGEEPGDGEPSREPETSTGQETPDPSPQPSEETPQEPPLVEVTPEPAPDDPPPEVTPQPPEDDGCNTIEELAELIARDGGGTVAVTGHLALPEGEAVWLEVYNPVTIDVGPYGITVPEGATLALSGPITLAGGGAPNPLLTVSGFLTTENGAAISASGENAVAVRLTGGRWNANQAAVSAAGADACAVEADGPLDLFRVQLTAVGENAICVRSTAPVRLILCRAESEGLLAAAPELTLDGTSASPEQSDAQIIRRVAVPYDAYATNGVWIEKGASQEELDNLLDTHLFHNTFEYVLIDEAQQAPDIVLRTAVRWTGGGVDLGVSGIYWFTGLVEDWDIGNLPPPEKRVPVYVADPARPAIQEAIYGETGVRLRFYRPIQGADRLTLWYSADMGSTWRDAGELPEAQIDAGGAYLPALPEPNRDYLFRLDVAGGPMAGRSNTMRYLFYDNQWGWGGGGDWDGGDWGDQGPLPDDDPAPPPDREPEVGTTPEPEPDGTPTEPDRGDGGDTPDDEPDPGDQPVERPERPDPPVTPAPSPTLGPPDIEVSFVEPGPTPTPAPTPTPEAAALPAETTPPVTSAPAEPAATPAPPSAPPSPTPAADAEPIPPALPEGATASLTGRDLEAQKLANPAGVTLAGDGLKVTLPYALTDALHLGKDGVLAVRLVVPEPGSFEVRFWADGREVADFGGGAFTVSVPVADAEGVESLCIAPDGGEIAASALTESHAEFELTATGVYTLSVAVPEAGTPATPQPTVPAETAASEKPTAQPAPILPVVFGALALGAAGGVLLWRRRGGR